jgi:hypothetical protein
MYSQEKQKMDRDEVKRKAAAEASLAKAEEHTKNHRRMTEEETLECLVPKPIGKPADIRWQEGHHTAYGLHPKGCDCGNHPHPLTGLEIRHMEEANKKRVAEFHAQNEADIIVPPSFAHALAAEGHREAQLVDPLYTEIRRLQAIIGSEMDTIHEELDELGEDTDEPEYGRGPAGPATYASAKDPVNSPEHYNQFGLECIDAIELTVGEEGFLGYCQGNAMKYLWRANYKGNKREDLQKAAWYARMASGDDPRE